MPGRPLVLAALVLAPTAWAFHNDEPIVATLTGEGDGWVAVRVEGAFAFDFMFDTDGPRSISGVALLHDDWSAITMFSTSGCGADGSAAMSVGDTRGAARLPFSCGSLTQGWGWGSWSSAVAVAWVTGDVASWRLDVRGAGATVVASSQGGALDLRASDFEQAVSADASAVLFGVRAGTGASYEVHADGVVFGAFGGSLGAERTSVVSPNGARACGCAFFGEPAGRYAFTVEGVGVTDGHSLLALASVRLPQ